MAKKLIDDADPIWVKKEGRWLVTGDSASFNDTLSYTLNVGDSMKVNFNGTFISVYGLIDGISVGAITNYSIDGGTPVQVHTQLAVGDVHDQLFWATKRLQPGPHTLNITIHWLNLTTPGEAPNEGTIWFDSFYVDESNISIRDTPLHPSSSRLRLPVGAIVGIVVGVLLCSLGAGYILWRWRHRQRLDSSASVSKEVGSQSSVDPFISPVLNDSRTSHMATESSAERLIFDPNLFIRRPAALIGHKSSRIMPDLPNHNQQFHKEGPRSESFGRGSLDVTTIGVPFEPQPTSQAPLPQRPPSSHASNGQPTGENGDPQREVIPRSPSESSVTAVPDGDGNIATPGPRQHVDSGVRVSEVILAPSSGTEGVELPPVYSPA